MAMRGATPRWRIDGRGRLTTVLPTRLIELEGQCMRIKYDADDDILYLAFSQEPIVRDISRC